MMIHEISAPVSNKGDWSYATQLRTEDNTGPLWVGSPPVDLVIYLYFADKNGTQVYSTKSSDGAVVSMNNDSYLTIEIPAIDMGALNEGRYAAFVKYTTSGATLSYLLGYLPVYEGF